MSLRHVVGAMLLVALVAASVNTLGAQSYNTITSLVYTGTGCKSLLNKGEFAADKCMFGGEKIGGFDVSCKSTSESTCATFNYDDGAACNNPNAPTRIAESGKCLNSTTYGFYKFRCTPQNKTCMVGLNCNEDCTSCPTVHRLEVDRCEAVGDTTVLLTSIGKCIGDSLTENLYTGNNGNETNPDCSSGNKETYQFWSDLCINDPNGKFSYFYQCSNQAGPSTPCTNAANCDSHAAAVSGNTNTGCQCTCRNMWQGAQCQTCPSNYGGADCSTCAPGFTNYPVCSGACTIAANCDSHAVAVSGNTNTGCQCTCRNMWQGAQCQTCPPNFDASADCGACALGYNGYPNCNN